jgi:hypothetical protein
MPIDGGPTNLRFKHQPHSSVLAGGLNTTELFSPSGLLNTNRISYDNKQQSQDASYIHQMQMSILNTITSPQTQTAKPNIKFVGIMNDRVKNQQKGHIGRAGGIVNIDELITAHVNQSGQTMVKNTP